MSRDPKMFVKPELIPKFVDACGKAGEEVRVICVDRPQVEQDALYAQSRYNLATVNSLRKVAGLPPITEAENNHAVTWTRKSEHLTNKIQPKSRAFDFGIFRNGKYITNDRDAYMKCALIGESLGLHSGRHFKNEDLPHLQVTPI